MGVVIYDKNGSKTDFTLPRPRGTAEKPVAEIRQKVDLPFIDAEAVQLSFNGISILYGNMQMKETQFIHFDNQDEPDEIEMHFSLAGASCLQNEISGKTYRFSANEQRLHYTPSFVGTMPYQKGAYYRFFEVRFLKQYFLELAGNSSPLLMAFADKVAGNLPAEVGEKNLPISFGMHQCIGEILQQRLPDGLKTMYLQSKCIELLALQTQLYEESHGRSEMVCKTAYDKERIYFVRDYLAGHAADPPSLSELAKIAGLNEFKLKKGFKEVFNTTVFGYLSDFKLNEARNGLLSGTSIKEVSEQLGYSSVQHFTSAFTGKFGVSPGRMRKN